jgi:hypothetical protein
MLIIAVPYCFPQHAGGRGGSLCGFWVECMLVPPAVSAMVSCGLPHGGLRAVMQLMKAARFLILSYSVAPLCERLSKSP